MITVGSPSLNFNRFIISSWLQLNSNFTQQVTDIFAF